MPWSPCGTHVDCCARNDPDQDIRRGHGRAIVIQAERLLVAAGCPKVNLQIREDNLEAAQFYAAVGHAPDPVVSYGKRLIED